MSNYRKPRLKPVVNYFNANNKVYFFKRPGFSISLNDKTGFILSAIKLMDGKKDYEQLIQILLKNYSSEVPYFQKLLETLDKELLIEDCAKNINSQLTEYDLERWSRNIEFFGAHSSAQDNKYLYQNRIKNAKVIILGLGGLGSSILFDMIALGVEHLKVVDFDKVELSNLNRQILYRENDIGSPKVDAAKKNIEAFSKTAKIEAINKKIASAQDIEELISGQDILISAADYPPGKIIDWINEVCIKNGIPFICGALDTEWAAYHSVIPGISGCIECWKSSAKKTNFLLQDIMNSESFKMNLSPNSTIIPFLSIASGLMASEFVKIISGIFPPSGLSKLTAFNFISSQIKTPEEWNKNPDCKICANVFYQASYLKSK
jgi:molybdopterin/thiamine biosynthesis adenylyltransferase